MDYPNYVLNELRMEGAPQLNDRNKNVRRVQEWLSLRGHSTAVDGSFGPATQSAVQSFQRAQKLPISGKVDTATWRQLTVPLQQALAAPVLTPRSTLAEAVLTVAKQHLACAPREVGGDNCGPWVRIYMSGGQGPEHYWCAGFVTFLLRQACNALGVMMPLPGSESCDSLAYQARERGLFVAGSALANGSSTWSELGASSIFLVRKNATDWTHTGFAHAGQREVFATIEGNTNDDGSRNGYEACARMRSLAKKDFIRLSS